MILKNIILLDDQECLKILNMRNSSDIRRNMYTSHEISLTEHKHWIANLRKNPKQLHFGVYYNDELVGSCSVNNIDRINQTADWGFYLEKKSQGKGIGALMKFTLLDFVFLNLKLEKLNSQVLVSNLSVVKMHEKFGFIKEGELRSQILKEGSRVNVLQLGILREEWNTLRESKIYVVERHQEEIDLII